MRKDTESVLRAESERKETPNGDSEWKDTEKNERKDTESSESEWKSVKNVLQDTQSVARAEFPSERPLAENERKETPPSVIRKRTFYKIQNQYPLESAIGKIRIQFPSALVKIQNQFPTLRAKGKRGPQPPMQRVKVKISLCRRQALYSNCSSY